MPSPECARLRAQANHVTRGKILRTPRADPWQRDMQGHLGTLQAKGQLVARIDALGHKQRPQIARVLLTRGDHGQAVGPDGQRHARPHRDRSRNDAHACGIGPIRPDPGGDQIGAANEIRHKAVGGCLVNLL